MFEVAVVYAGIGGIWAGAVALFGWSQGAVPTVGELAKHAMLWPFEAYKLIKARVAS